MSLVSLITKTFKLAMLNMLQRKKRSVFIIHYSYLIRIVLEVRVVKLH